MDRKVLEARRALYEKKVVVPNTVKWSDEQGCYVGTNAWIFQFFWSAFNAALDSVEIELPKHPWEPQGMRQSTYGDALTDCRAAIESTNLGLRVK